MSSLSRRQRGLSVAKLIDQFREHISDYCRHPDGTPSETHVQMGGRERTAGLGIDITRWKALRG
jgi:hypothetical protein